jgi:carbonic anhydrase/acetyltransferase-like protein (isoleucine patch superfamily)
MRGRVKSALNVVAMILMAPAAATCWLQERVLPGIAVFTFWSHVVSQLPGYPGVFLRRGFYRLMLDACAENVRIEFGAIVNRRATVGAGAYIGTYALLGWVQVGRNALIGSRVSIPSGDRQHHFLPNGTWSPTEDANMRCVSIGDNTWIGEGAVVMADVGGQCMVAAGAVVSSPVPDGILVAGNPARFVRRVVD